MNVRDLKKLEMENLSNGGRAILDAVGPSYEYRNGQKTDKVNGLKVTVVFPANRYAKHTITVADPVDRLTAVLDTTPAGNEICVRYIGCLPIYTPLQSEGIAQIYGRNLKKYPGISKNFFRQDPAGPARGRLGPFGSWRRVFQKLLENCWRKPLPTGNTGFEQIPCSIIL